MNIIKTANTTGNTSTKKTDIPKPDVIGFDPNYRGWYRLKTKFRGVGECLESNAAETTNDHGGAAYMVPCQDVSGQFWKLEPAGEGYYFLKSMYRGADECLESNDPASPAHFGGAHMALCRGVTGQRW